MIAGIFVGLALLSTVLFPWPVTALLGLIASFFEPFAAFAVGIIMDALTYSVHAARFPYATLLGATASALMVFVRSRLTTGPVR